MILYLFIKYLILNIKYTSILNKVYKNENFIQNLSKHFNVEFKKDWIGRIYAIFNPNIQDGIFDPNRQIYEYNNEGLSRQAYIESYIIGQLSLIKQFIKANNLFDLLTYKLVKLDEYDNYLFIIQPITLQNCLKYSKILAYILGCLLIIGIILIFLF